MADDWKTPDAKALFEAIGTLDGLDETERFFRDLCTLTELRDLSQRWAVARLLDEGLHYAEISQRTGASTATITRIASWLNHGEGGYRAVLDTDAVTERLRLAVPNKGRLVEPTLRLLHDAGLVFEEHDRSLVARVQNFDLDILFVRTNDVIEFVGDGVADLGITGVDLLSEAGRRTAAGPRPRLRPLPAGRRRPHRQRLPDHRRTWPVCASPRPTRTRPGASSPARHRRRRHPDLGRRRGRAAARPRRGHRRSRVDRLHARHERPAPGRRRPRERGDPRREPDGRSSTRRRSSKRIDTMLSAVLAARGRKYLMMNAPAACQGDLETAPAVARVADRHPAGPRRDDRRSTRSSARTRSGGCCPD